MKRLALLLCAVMLFGAHARAQGLLSSTSNKQSLVQSLNITASGTQTALESTGYSRALITASTGVATASAQFELQGSPNGGTTYFPVPMVRQDDALGTVSVGSGALSNPTRTYTADISGFNRVRINVTSYSSGTMVVTLTLIAAPTDVVSVIPTLPSLTIGTFPDNEPFNIAQIAGVTPLTGNGASGTGAQRVTLADNSTGVIAAITGNVVPGTSATHLGKAEDSPHGTGDTGVAVLAKRTDTPSVSSITDGDYVTFNSDSTGRLWVNATGQTLTVAGALTHNNAAPAAGNVGVLAGVANAVAPAVGEGNATLLSTDLTGAARTAHALSATTTQTISATGALAAVNVASYSSVRVTITGTHTGINFGFEGSPVGTFTAFSLRGQRSSTGDVEFETGVLPNNTTRSWLVDTKGFAQFRLNVSAFSTGSGSISITGVAAASSLPGIASASGTVAQASTTSGQAGMLMQGAVTTSAPTYTTAQTSPLSLSTTGDLRVTLGTALAAGIDSIMPYTLPASLVRGSTSAITGTSDTSVIAAGGSGVRNYITSLSIINSHATVGTVVELKTATTVIWRGYAGPNGGGFAITFPAPLRGGSNEAINCAAVTTGANVYCSAAGFSSTN